MSTPPKLHSEYYIWHLYLYLALAVFCTPTFKYATQPLCRCHDDGHVTSLVVRLHHCSSCSESASLLIERLCISHYFQFSVPTSVAWQRHSANAKARFPSKRNRLRCVRCVWMETALNASACVGKQPIMVASSCHCFDRASYWLQAAADRMLGQSSGNHDWLLANASACV